MKTLKEIKKEFIDANFNFSQSFAMEEISTKKYVEIENKILDEFIKQIAKATREAITPKRKLNYTSIREQNLFKIGYNQAIDDINNLYAKFIGKK